MLRTGIYRLWKASECASWEMNCVRQAALRSLTHSEGNFVINGFARSFSTGSEEQEERVITNPKVLELADQITQLNLLEVSDLTEILRKRLNIQGGAAGGMPYGFPPMGMQAMAAPAAGGAAAEQEAKPVEEKTDFSIKLDGFDAAAKIKVIKEVRSITDLGLKEAKELVESAPAVLRKGVKKEEAEQIKAKLEAAGAKIVLE